MVPDLERLYDRVEQSLARFEPYGLLLAGIGVETYFRYHETVEETMARSHVDRWSLPRKRS